MVLDKDAFVQENWQRISKIARDVSFKLHRKFTSVEYEDLYGYAMLGIVEALSKIDTTNMGWKAYLYQCSVYAAFAGAMKMLGLSRIRTKEGVDWVGVDVRFHSFETLKKMGESANIEQLLEAMNILSEIILKDERLFVKKCLGHSLEGQVFECLTSEKDVRSTMKKLKLSRYMVCQIFQRIVLIYKLARENLPYQHLLTPPREISD